MSSHVVMAISICISASKQKSCYIRVQLCWLWISGYRPRESWLASVAASLVQWLWNEGTSRVSVQKAEQMQVNHLPLTAVGCTQEWAQNQHSPLTYWPPPLGGEGLMPSNRCAGGRFWTAGHREISIICELHNSIVSRCTWKATIVHPTWDGVGASGWVWLGTWHSTASIHCRY